MKISDYTSRASSTDDEAIVRNGTSNARIPIGTELASIATRLDAAESGTSVADEDELAASVTAGDTAITVTAMITLTTKVTIPEGTTLRILPGAGFEFDSGNDLLQLDGTLLAGQYQVFFNAVGHSRSGTEMLLDGVTKGSVWGEFGHRPRYGYWWGAAPENGDVADAIQATLDSGRLSELVDTQNYWVSTGTDGMEVVFTGKLSSGKTTNAGGVRAVVRGEDTMSQITYNIVAGQEVMGACWNAIHHHRDYAFFVGIEKMRFDDAYTAADRAVFRTNKMNEQSRLDTVYITNFNKFGLLFDNPPVAGGFKLGALNQGRVENFWVIGGKQADAVGICVESNREISGPWPTFAGGGMRICNGTVHHDGLANLQLKCHSGSWIVENVNFEQTSNLADNFCVLLGDAPGGDTDLGRWGVNYQIRGIQPSETSALAPGIRITDLACSYNIEGVGLSPVAAEAGSGRILITDDALNVTDEPNHELAGDLANIGKWARQAKLATVASGGYIKKSNGTVATGVSPIVIDGREIYWQIDLGTYG